MKTKFKIVIYDEIYYWSDDIKKVCSNIFTVYLYDKSVITHCCEITPSYELHPLYYVPVFKNGECCNHPDNMDWVEIIDREFINEQIIYVHCSDVERNTSGKNINISYLNKSVKNRDSDRYQDVLTEACDYLNCNHVY